MKQIIDNKIYDTEKATKIFDYRRRCKGDDCLFKPGYSFYYWTDAQIYKTFKGNYFLHYDEKAGYKEFIEASTKEEAKKIIKKLDPDKYIELFGNVDLEEA